MQINENILFLYDGLIKSISIDPTHTLRALFQRLMNYIETEIEIVNHKIKNPSLINLDRSTISNVPELLTWTDKKAALIELIYAIANSINGGKSQISKIARCFEFIFQVDLGNYYHILTDINLRKSNQTRYLDSLPDKLKKVLDHPNK